MKITLLDSKQVGVQLKRLMNESTEYHWAVAWATETELAKVLLANKKKIRYLVIGTDFAQTSPVLLRELKSLKNVHVKIGDGRRTFHPKVYGFINNKKVSIIVGSANFTNGGTNLNDEASLLVEGSLEDQPILEILNSVSSWWEEGEEIKEDFLTAYELRCLANQKHRQAIAKPLKIYRPTLEAEHPELLSTSWKKFVAAVKNDPSDSIGKRLNVLQFIRQLFENVNKFSDLPLLERKAIAGIIGDKEVQGTSLEGLGWGWFGSMKGAGAFKNRIGDNDAHLSAALEHIPLTGAITENDYLQFAREFQHAFADAKRQGGVPTASRLLAMKRPDYFVCVDRKNAPRLGADVGFAPSTLRLENYWERVVEPITQALWWNADRPIGKDAKIWDARAAMLDVIYYDWE